MGTARNTSPYMARRVLVRASSLRDDDTCLSAYTFRNCREHNAAVERALAVLLRRWQRNRRLVGVVLFAWLCFGIGFALGVAI